ncbi:MAG: signal peptidase I [Clostridia bacterium]|nr:signal peptidase I [Clostridia bacterium]
MRQKSGALYDVVSVLTVALALVSLLFTFIFRQVTVVGDSMNDTLMDQDRLLVSCLFYTTPERGDIVIVDRYTEEPLIKRVIAVAGDSVYIDPTTGLLYLNGEVQDEPYVHYENFLYDLYEPVMVPDGCVFVMGDHRNNSLDSRTSTIGFVDVRDIAGKALFRIRPLSEFGSVYE